MSTSRVLETTAKEISRIEADIKTRLETKNYPDQKTVHEYKKDLNDISAYLGTAAKQIAPNSLQGAEYEQQTKAIQVLNKKVDRIPLAPSSVTPPPDPAAQERAEQERAAREARDAKVEAVRAAKEAREEAREQADRAAHADRVAKAQASQTQSISRESPSRISPQQLQGLKRETDEILKDAKTNLNEQVNRRALDLEKRVDIQIAKIGPSEKNNTLRGSMNMNRQDNGSVTFLKGLQNQLQNVQKDYQKEVQHKNTAKSNQSSSNENASQTPTLRRGF